MKSSIPICKTLDQEESVQPKECNSDLHLINSIDKQFPTSKASQHGKWGVERQQQQSHPPLLTLSNSALPLSQALQTWGAKWGTIKPKLLIFPLLSSPDWELRCQCCQETPEILLQGLKRGKGERGKEAETLVHLWTMPLLLPPSRTHFTEQAGCDKEKEMVQKSVLL